MRFRILGLLGALAMLSACANTPDNGAKTNSSSGDAPSSETAATGSQSGGYGRQAVRHQGG